MDLQAAEAAAEADGVVLVKCEGCASGFKGVFLALGLRGWALAIPILQPPQERVRAACSVRLPLRGGSAARTAASVDDPG